jgi:hypothetical protein
MSLREQQDLLARLYTDPDLRATFLAGGPVTASISDAELAELRSVAPEELEYYSRSLVGKRLAEIRKLLPLSSERMKGDFAARFREFAPAFNPSSTKKHLEDAIAFARWLAQRTSDRKIREALEFDLAKLEFFGEGRRLVVRIHLFDIVSGKRRLIPRIRLWLRFGKRTLIV